VTLGESAPGAWYGGVPAFSPDGKILAVVGDFIRLWDVNTGELIQKFIIPVVNCDPRRASFSPDGSFIVASETYCDNDTGHLMVWDIKSGDLVQNWDQEYAEINEPSQGLYHRPVWGFSFSPDGSSLAYSTGKTVEIRDIQKDSEPIILQLGEKMFASEISFSENGKLLYVFMEWDKTQTWPADYKTKFAVQVWNLTTQTIQREIDFPEADYTSEGMELYGKNIIHFNFVKGTSDLTDLSTGGTTSFLYRQGWRYFSPDLKFMVAMRYFGFDEKDQGLELWNTDTWRNVYSFKPNFGKDWFYEPVDIIFSPDNATLVIVHGGQVSLWDIRPLVKP
jgi:WD40 repeat protein